MTTNVTEFSNFILSAYIDIGPFKFLLFIIILCLYLVIIFSNFLLILVICLNRSLHEPMYLFLCSLFANELYGSAGLFPFLLVQILSDVHTIPTSFCFLQIYWVYTYGNVEFLILAIMSYDRYLAICYPLQYNMRMNANKVAALIALVWLYPFLSVLVMLSLTLRLQLCSNIIDKVYCDNYPVVRQACSDVSVNNIYGIVYMFTIILSLVVLNLFSYIKILKICFSGSKPTRQKAVSTCCPHLASLVNFSFGCFFEVLQSRFDTSNLPTVSRIFLSLYFLTSPPLFNPVVYGLNLAKVRVICKNWLLGRV